MSKEDRPELEEELRRLGLPETTWPKAEQGSRDGNDGINNSKLYAMGLKLWISRLKNQKRMPEGEISKALKEITSMKILSKWESFACTVAYKALGQDEEKANELEYHTEETEDPGQIIGASIILKDEQKYEAALISLIELLRGKQRISKRERDDISEIIISSEFIIAENSTEGAGLEKLKNSIQVQKEKLKILKVATTNNRNNEAEANNYLRERIESILDLIKKDTKQSGLKA